jgi:hypothetical protein
VRDETMKKLNIFELSKHDGPHESWPMDTELIKNGISTGKKIPGYIIEAQYEHVYGFLLVTSWDCPFEESQSFLLLSHELDLVFEETIGAAYASVWIEGHEPINEHAVMFHCGSNLDIFVTVESANKLRLEKYTRVNGKKFST